MLQGDTESRYAQNERRKPLAATLACERFSYYIIGKHIEIETPLVSLPNNKNLDTIEYFISH